MIRIIECTAKPDFTLQLKLNDGRKGLINIEHLLKGKIYEPVRDSRYFVLAEIDDFGSICWPNGADIAIETLVELLPAESKSLVGNKNAQIDDEPRNETIIIRVSSTMKNNFTHQASKNGKNLSSWILHKLNAS